MRHHTDVNFQGLEMPRLLKMQHKDNLFANKHGNIYYALHIDYKLGFPKANGNLPLTAVVCSKDKNTSYQFFIRNFFI